MSRYSNSAIPQLTKIASHSGACLCLKCPYHANAINTFEHVKRITGNHLEFVQSLMPPNFLLAAALQAKTCPQLPLAGLTSGRAAIKTRAMKHQPHPGENRREFIKTSAAAALAAPFILAGSARAQSSPGETLRVGLVGCGGRGSGAAAQALSADKNVVLTAVGDAFEDQLHRALPGLRKTHPEKVKVEPDHCFTGFDAYQKVINSGVDVVILATPPGFRPMHIKAAIDAGKHVFAEKPVAVDAPGVRAVLAAA